MTDTFTQSDDIALLVCDLIAAQAEFPTIEKDGTNPHFNSRFATLGATIQGTRTVLNKHNLVLTQWPVRGGLKTRLLHASGQWIAEEMDLHAQETPQGQGSGLTYARRYAWQSILGIDTGDDDDGNAAQQNFREGSGKQTEHGQAARTGDRNPLVGQPDTAPASRGSQSGGQREVWPISEGQKKALWAKSGGGKDWQPENVCKQVYGKREADLTWAEAKDLLDGLTKGTIVPGAPQAGGMESVSNAFPGAEEIGSTENIPGYDERPF